MDRRVHVRERPLVGRQLAVRVHVPLAGQSQQLALGERRVEDGQRQTVEGQVPRRVPRVLPGVGHRQDVVVVQLAPVAVAAVQARIRWRPAGRVAVEPLRDVVVVQLLAPDEPGEGLPLDERLVVVEGPVGERGVERVGLADPGRRRSPPPPARVASVRALGQPEQDRLGRAGRDRQLVAGGHLGPGPGRVDRRRDAIDDRRTDPVLDERRGVGTPHRRSVFVSLSVNRSVGVPSATRWYSPSCGCSARTDDAAVGRARGDQRRSGRDGDPTSRCCGTRASAGGWSGAGIRSAVGHR